MWYQSHLKARVVQETFHTPHQHAINTPPSASIHDLGAMRRQRSDGSFKPRVPSFLGENDLDAYLAWEKEMELVFSYHHYTQEKKVRKAASTFIGHAINWWEETKFIRRYYGESQITSWSEMKAVMKKRFVSTYDGRDVHPKLRRMYQDSISADGYYQEMEPLSRRATRLEQPDTRRGAIRSHCVAASNPTDIRGNKSLETHKGTQTTKLVQGGQEESAITPTRTRNVVCLSHVPECINNKITFSLDSGRVVSAKEDSKPEGEEDKATINTLLLEETALATPHTVPSVQPLPSKGYAEFVSMNPSMESTNPRNREEQRLELVQRTVESSKTVGRSSSIVQSIILHDELDLRTNPFKGGGDGVILEKLELVASHQSPDKKPQEEIDKEQRLVIPTMTKTVESFRSNDEESKHEEEELHVNTKVPVEEGIITVSSLNVFASSRSAIGIKEPASPRERGYLLQPQQNVEEGDQQLVLTPIIGSKEQPDLTPGASLSDFPAFKIKLMGDLKLVKELQNLVFEPGGANHGIKGVNNILDQEVKSLQLSLISKELDLRSNPVKGGEYGAILERPDMIIIRFSSEEEQAEKRKMATAGLGEIGKRKGFNQELSGQRETGWTQEAKASTVHMLTRQLKVKLPMEWPWPRNQRAMAYAKTPGSAGSAEDSKARKARPPDGSDMEQHLVPRSNWSYTRRKTKATHALAKIVDQRDKMDKKNKPACWFNVFLVL